MQKKSLKSDFLYALFGSLSRDGIRLQMARFQGGAALVAQMVEQDFAELGSGAAAERVKHQFVLAHRRSPALFFTREVGRVAHATDASGERGIGRLQHVVARRL